MIRNKNEEYETTYEELQANGEEILSSNEELQSINEELETSKEELQSSNEELSITNEELRKKNMELSESQAQLKRVNEQLKQFAFISSHDLQEPLRKIEFFSDLLLNSEANLNEHAKKYAHKINGSASRMSMLIKDLLDFSRLLESGNTGLKAVDLNEILSNVVSDFEVIIEQKKAIVQYSPLPTIQAVAIQMNQLFHNLISNALKFSKENPIIKIASRGVTSKDFLTYPDLNKETHYVSINVKDNGVGFDEKYISKMFIFFQRLHDAKGFPGNGMGLAICKKDSRGSQRVHFCKWESK